MKNGLLLTLFAISNFVQGQEIRGKWYFFSSDMLGIIETSYDSSMLSGNRLNWDLSIVAHNSEKRIVKSIRKSGNIYLVVADTSNPNFEVLVIFDFKKDTSFRLPFLNEKAKFQNLEQALNFIEHDSTLRYGLINYSKKEMDRINRLPYLGTISESDYKLLSSQFNTELAEYKSNFLKMDLNFMFFYFYMPSKIRELLINLGYNALVSDAELDKLNHKFKDLPKIEMKLR